MIATMRRVGHVTALALSAVLVTAAPAVAAGPDRTPPTRPGTPVVTGVTDTTVSLAWRPSYDNSGSVSYQVYNEAGAADILLGVSTVPRFTVTGRQPRTTAYYYVVARDRTGNVSSPSGQVFAETAPDTTPPSAPGTPTMVETTAVSTAIAWAPATDNFLLYKYDVYFIGDYGYGWLAGSTGPNTTTFSHYGLVADRDYTYYVVATDLFGNVGPESGRLTVRTRPASTGAICRARFDIVGSGTQFQAAVQVRNMTTTSWADFTIGFTWPDGQVVLPPWNQWVIQTGADVSIHVVRSPTSGSGPVFPGGQHTESFYASHSGSNRPPSVITVDGQPCDAL
jgi:hypothetical protein